MIFRAKNPYNLSSMAIESMICFRRIWLLRKVYYLINIFSMKIEVCMCNISMELIDCRLHGGIKRLHNLINHTTNPWLRTLEYNSFQTCWKLSESNTFNNYLCSISVTYIGH